MYFENIDYESLYTIARHVGWTVALQAQNFQVQAVSGEEKLSYAYIYLNGRVCGIADQDGAFNIPHSKLHIGDTIPASYVGARPAFAVYTKNWPANPNVRSNAARLGVGRGRSKFQIQHLALFQQKRPETHPAGLIAPERTGGPMIFVSLPVKSCGHDDKSQTTVPRTRRTDIR